MKRCNPSIQAVLAVLLIGAVLVTAVSPAFGQGPRHKGKGEMDGFGKLLKGLNLSETQKTGVEAVRTRYSDERQALRKRMSTARSRFRSVMMEQGGNEAVVRLAFQEMVPVLEDRAVLNAKVFAEIRNLLTPEQLKMLSEKQERQFQKRQKQRFGNPDRFESEPEPDNDPDE